MMLFCRSLLHIIVRHSPHSPFTIHHSGVPKVLEQIQPSDDLYIAAYPSFNVGEIIAIAELSEGTGKPIVVFNGAHGMWSAAQRAQCALNPAKRLVPCCMLMCHR